MTPDQVRRIHQQYGSPVFVYDEATLRQRASEVLNFPNAFGLTPRYAMKANPHAAILRLFDSCGLHIDAGSGFEAERAIHAGIPANHISISSQEMAQRLEYLVASGVHFNATSLNQIKEFGEMLPGQAIGLRINPGLGSGGTHKTNVGGPAASFGLWHEFLDEAIALCAQYDLTVTRIHTHIGSGSDPDVWQKVALMSLDMVRRFPQVDTLNLGGGYKVGRMADEPTTDLQAVGAPVKEAFENFARETGRELHLEIEPGTYLVANAGALVSRVQDIVSTGAAGYEFIRLDCGMTDIMRPSLYGAQHPLIVVPREERDSASTREYVVVGHCCESGDLLTPAPNDPNTLQPRTLPEAQIGDLMVIEGAGAYCASMSAATYNSFPRAAQVLMDASGSPRLIYRRQTLAHMVTNETG